MIRALAALAALTAAVLAPSVAAHGDGGARGFRSVVTAVRPPTDVLSVEVLDFDDRLHLQREGDLEIVILGYEGEPYLRFDQDGVWRNTRSPATYLNDDRYGAAVVPNEADPNAVPRWEHLSDGTSWEWHDHRIHWMSTADPPIVRKAPEVAHHVLDWKVPGLIGGRRFVIEGSLDYRPPDVGDRPPVLYLAAPLVAVLLVGLYVRRRRAGVGGG